MNGRQRHNAGKTTMIGISLIGLGSLVMSVSQVAGLQAQDTADPKTQPEQWCVFEPEPAPTNPKHIVLISGDEEYRSEEALPMLGKLLARRHGFLCTVLFPIDPKTGEIDPNNQNNIPGMHHLENADLVIMALRFRHLPDKDMRYFVDYLNAGKPIIGLRTSTHAFRYPETSDSEFKKYTFNSRHWPGGFGKQVLGETWVSHHGRHKVQSTRGVVNPEQAEHPLLRGVDDVWGPTDVYGVNQLPADATVLLYGQVLQGMQPTDAPLDGPPNDPMMPLAWIRDYETESGETSRIFCTTMGASNDFANAGLRRLIVNAAFWCLGLEAQIAADANVDIVGEYSPTMYGFDSFQKGMKPADFR